jgi:uncharacterized protein
MEAAILQGILAVLSGVLVGFSLGLVGGGGSILAVPLLAYVVGVPNPHVAIGTSAVAVAVNAAINLATHARRGNVRWHCAAVFAGAGIIGAFLGSTLGKSINGHLLLALFACLMIVVGLLMLRNRHQSTSSEINLDRRTTGKLGAFGFATGALSGFFGIGGGFLIVPGLMAATAMPIGLAVGSSLVAVAAFGFTTSLNYAVSGLVDWPLAAFFILGGAAGGYLGVRLSMNLAARRGALNMVFASLIFVTAAYMLVRSIASI